MKKGIFVISMIFIVVLCVEADAKSNDPKTLLITKLNEIENLYFKYLSSTEKQEAVALMNEIRNIIVANSIPQPTPAQYDYNVLNEEGFQDLYLLVTKEISDSKKNEIIEGALGKKGKIICKQLAQLVALYTHDLYKKELLLAIADNIFDPVNIGMVLKYFSSSLYQKELADFFKNR